MELKCTSCARLQVQGFKNRRTQGLNLLPGSERENSIGFGAPAAVRGLPSTIIASYLLPKVQQHAQKPEVSLVRCLYTQMGTTQ